MGKAGMTAAAMHLAAALLAVAPLAAHGSSVGAQPVQPAAPGPTIAPGFRLTAPQTTTLKNLGTAYARSGNAQALQSGWQALIAGARPAGGDIDALVQIVLQQAAQQAQEDLKAIMAKVKALNDRKEALRTELQRVRDAEAALARGQRVLPFKPGGILTPAPPAATAADLVAYRKRLESAFNMSGDDAQLANTDLQNVLQKQQQTLQMLSSVSKMLNDTAMSIVKKLGG